MTSYVLELGTYDFSSKTKNCVRIDRFMILGLFLGNRLWNHRFDSGDLFSTKMLTPTIGYKPKMIAKTFHKGSNTSRLKNQQCS